MSKGTLVSILTFVDIMRMMKTELSLVALGVIELLNLILGISAIVTMWALVVPCDERADCWDVGENSRWSSSICCMVVVRADFQVMVPFLGALLGFK